MKNISKFLALIFLITSFSGLIAQNDLPIWKKLRYLSEEEMNLEVRSVDGFVETDPPTWPIKNVAEFDQMQAVIVRYPFGIPVSVMKEIAEDLELITLVSGLSQENTVKSIYESNEVNLDNCTFIHAPTNSWWVRDYGPWFVFDGDGKPGIVDFPYNRPRPNDNNIPAAVAEHLGIDLYGMNVYHTGGNYMTDGLGKSSSTDLVVEENPMKTEDEIDSLHYNYLAIEDYYLMYDPLDDYIKHIDCWGKFLTPGKVLIGQVPESDYRYPDFEAAADFFANTISSYGAPYEVFRVYTPGNNLTTPYTNCIIVNDKILVPLSGSPWDDEALVSYEEAMPGYKIVGIFYNSWYNTDALHCRSKGVADLGMLYVEHMPILGQQTFLPEILISANISAYSGSELIADSTIVNFKVNDGAYQSEKMIQNDDGIWTCTLTGFEALDEIDYYIEVKDASGRKARHPFIGEKDPHEFSLSQFEPELIMNPDTLLFDSMEDLQNGLEASIFNNMFAPTQIFEVELPQSFESQIQLNDFPNLPYELAASSELNFILSFSEPLPEQGLQFFDSIIIKTLHFEYPLYFEIDLTGVNTFDLIDQSLIEVYPNPSSDSFIFDYYLSKKQRIHLTILNMSGDPVFAKKMEQYPGQNKCNWNGKDQLGKEIPGGNYYYSIKLNDRLIQGIITKL